MGDERNKLPAGFVFSPTNEEIIKYYLKPLMDERKDAYLSIIYKTDELYGENVDIESTFKKGLTNHRQYVDDDDSVWFFTKLKRLGRRFQRKAGVGNWTGTDSGKVAYEDKKESLKGKIRCFAYTELVLHDGKPPKRKRSSDVANNANWIMHEFSIEKDGKQYSDYVIVKIRRRKTSSSSHQLAAVEDDDAHATYQFPLPISVYYQHETAAPPLPLQDAQQGEYNWDLCMDSLMADQEGNIHVPVAADDFRAIEGVNAVAQDHYQQSTNAAFVTKSEVEAVRPEKEISDDEFALDLEFLLSGDGEVQPEEEFSVEEILASMNFCL